ncbi:MAG: PI-PLC domain-containing protein [Solirubrobacteraceae bacterium]
MSTSSSRTTEARPPRRGRTSASIALAIFACVAVVIGGACLYVRQQLLDSHSFADRTVSALAREPVRRVVAREIVVQAIDKSSPDLIAARPVITSVVETVVGTRQFRSLIHTVAEQAHRLLFQRGGNVAFSIADAGTVVISALRTLAPKVAAKIPPDLDVRLLDLRRQSFAVRTLRYADDIRTFGLVLPFVALALFALAIAVAPRRRLAITRCAVALSVAAVAVYVDLALLRHTTLSNLFGSEELTNADVRGAAGALWDSYIGGLSKWALLVAAAGAVLAAASANVLRPYAAVESFSRMRRRTWPPSSRGGRMGIGVAGLAGGVLLISWPTLALDVVVVLGGLLLLYFGTGELLSAIGAPGEDERITLKRSRVGALAAASSLGVLIGGAAIALAGAGPSASRPPTLAQLTCNGYSQLCSRRVDQVAFAGVHNAMSAADSPGWLIANQAHGIARQLDDGIRAFKISTHYGIGSKPGQVRTDIAAEGARANRVSEKLSGEARSALQRFSGSLGFGPAKGKPSVWLCHTLCELGATSMSSFLGTVAKFLKQNPGQVLIFFDEDYVSERSLQDEFKRAGLFSHLAVLREGQQMPTLGELVRSQHNVLVFTQEPVSGRYPWNMYGFKFIQDTPLKAVKPKQFTCRHNRGLPSSPLLMMNNWADVFPPRRSPNLPLTKRAFILHRARQCESERHHIPNLILTDFYDSGDVVGAARVINGLGNQKPAPIVPLERG